MVEIGYVVGTIIASLIVLVAIIVIIAVWVRDSYDKGLISLVAFVVALIVAGLYVWASYPSFDMKYHSYKPVAGTVEKINSRIVSDGDSVNQKFVVIFKGDSQEYGCVDTRCSLVQPGDQLSLSCIQVFVYAGTDGFDCQFVKREE